MATGIHNSASHSRAEFVTSAPPTITRFMIPWRRILIITVIPILLLFFNTGLSGQDRLSRKITPAEQHLLIRQLLEAKDCDTLFWVLIKLRPGSESAGLLPLLSHHSGYTSDGIIKTCISAANIAELSEQDDVESVFVMNTFRPPPGNNHKKNLLLGIIDKGFAWDDPCFKDPASGRSRVISYWNQSEAGKGKNTLSNTPYGVEIIPSDIAPEAAPSFGEKGHGWLIASIAGGDIRLEFSDRRPMTALNTPLNCPLVLVDSTCTENGLLDAVAHIAQRARALNAHFLITFAYSKYFTPGKCDSLYLRALSRLLGEDGLLVVSSGNDGGKSFFVDQKAEKEMAFRFTLKKSAAHLKENPDSLMGSISLWIPRGLKSAVSLRSPQGAQFGPVFRNGVKSFRRSGGEITIANSVSSPHRSYHEILISFTAAGSPPPPDGEWTIILKNNRSQGSVRAFMTKMRSCRLRFTGNGVNDGVSSLAFAPGVISAGALSLSPAAANTLAEASYSNIRHYVGNNTAYPQTDKEFYPTVLTWGEAGVLFKGERDPYPQQGSSVSAALIARLLAIAWEKQPEWSPPDLKNKLSGLALHPGDHPFTLDSSSTYRYMIISDFFKLLAAPHNTDRNTDGKNTSRTDGVPQEKSPQELSE